MGSKYCTYGADDVQRAFPSSCEGDCGSEREFWDSVAQEPARLSGLRVALYSLRRAKNRHPLYKEASVDGKGWEFSGPWEMPGSIEFLRSDSVTPEATESGKRTSSEARIWIARREFELVEAPLPKEGDVIQFWGEAPFGPVKSETYWDVVKATADGEVWSTNEFVQYRLELRKKGKFKPVRKVESTP